MCVLSEEDKIDLEIIKEYLKENGTLELIPFEEAIKEWDID